MNAAPDWFLDEKFWTTLYPFVFREDTFEAARKQVEGVVALSGCTTGTILDLACGPGRHVIPFAQRAFRLTGVNCTPFLLEEARAYSASTHVEVEWVRDDIRHFCPGDV